jgi:predicted dehydrogenase
MDTTISRRDFAGLAGSTLAAPNVLGANDRVRAAFIGTANRGGQLIKAALPHKDVEIVALCDLDANALNKQKAIIGSGAETYTDFRKVIDRKDIDAIVIATPDHWHAIQTTWACRAGKDVYVEKPLSVTIHEGQRMVDVARETKRIVQVGTHRRSSVLYPKMKALIDSGEIGKVTVARAYRITNMAPNGIGKSPDVDPPAGFDWDMWLGPRPKRGFRPTIHPYKFRWWTGYSSQIGNWGVHYFDAIRWVLGEDAPIACVALGGKYAVDDDRTIPDTMEAVFETAGGRLIIFGQYEASGVPAMYKGEFELRGTKGAIYAEEKSFEVVPEKGGQFQSPEPRTKPLGVETSEGDATVKHMRNFLDCIKSRQRPNADVEDGHKSTTYSLLGQMALSTRQRIDYDPKSGRILNPTWANDMLHYEYRAPWVLG